MKPKLELDQAKVMTWGEVNEVKDTCQSCQGSGFGINADCKCDECGGSGESWRPMSPDEIELYEYYIKTIKA